MLRKQHNMPTRASAPQRRGSHPPPWLRGAEEGGDATRRRGATTIATRTTRTTTPIRSSTRTTPDVRAREEEVDGVAVEIEIAIAIAIAVTFATQSWTTALTR